MTIERTRELLGKKVAHLSDKDIIELNNRTSNMCDAIIKVIKNDGNDQKNNSIKVNELTVDEQRDKNEPRKR